MLHPNGSPDSPEPAGHRQARAPRRGATTRQLSDAGPDPTSPEKDDVHPAASLEPQSWRQFALPLRWQASCPSGAGFPHQPHLRGSTDQHGATRPAIGAGRIAHPGQRGIPSPDSPVPRSNGGQTDVRGAARSARAAAAPIPDRACRGTADDSGSVSAPMWSVGAVRPPGERRGPAASEGSRRGYIM